MTEIVKGQRCRVVIEGVVDTVSSFDGAFSIGANYIEPDYTDDGVTVTAEVIQPTISVGGVWHDGQHSWFAVQTFDGFRMVRDTRGAAAMSAETFQARYPNAVRVFPAQDA